MSITPIAEHGDPSSSRDHRIARLARRSVQVIACAVVLFQLPVLLAAELRWMPQQSHHVETALVDTTLSVHTTGSDPYLVWQLRGALQASERVLEFEYFSVTGVGSVHGYLGPPITEASRFAMPDLGIAEGWQSYSVDIENAIGGPIPNQTSRVRIDFGVRAGARLQIRNVRLRERTSKESATAEEIAQGKLKKQLSDLAISKYLDSSFEWNLHDIHVGLHEITLSGECGNLNASTGNLRLVEYASHHAIDSEPWAASASIENNDGRLNIALPRFDGKRDRIHSGWRIARINDQSESTFVSARRFADTVQLENDHPQAQRARPKSQKGLSGVSRRGPLSELPELGVDAITLNLVLNRFLTSDPSEPNERIDVDGAPIYFNRRAFAPMDELIAFAREHEMIVSAIILIPRSRTGQRHSALVHPQANGGVYAMPDLSSQRGAEIYSYVLDQIARRYANVERKPGGISNWIAHNEVDFHTVWTNMGLQPRRVYLETYYRSMRMIQATARKYNPHARVYASLTHNWNVPDDGRWKRLAPRETLQWLQQLSQMEGDFPWGIAFHPYPESLFAELPWNDPAPRRDLRTPLITIQNLEVLGQFIELPEMRNANGNVRPVLLSEQGFHSASYSAEDQDRQAASLQYALNKVRGLPWIESFHYHRWIDHPDEGGLLLGLRTLPDGKERNGRRKRAWKVFQAFGTPRESEAIEGLPQAPPLPIE